MRNLRIVFLITIMGGLIASCSYSTSCPVYSLNIDMQVDTEDKDKLEKPAKI